MVYDPLGIFEDEKKEANKLFDPLGIYSEQVETQPKDKPSSNQPGMALPDINMEPRAGLKPVNASTETKKKIPVFPALPPQTGIFGESAISLMQKAAPEAELEYVAPELKAVGRGAAEGLTTELPKMIGSAGEFAGRKLENLPEDDPQYVLQRLVGKALKGAGKYVEEKSTQLGEKIYGPELDYQDDMFNKWAYEGSKMLAPSAVPGQVINVGLRWLSGIGKILKGAKIAESVGDTAAAAKLLKQAEEIAKVSNEASSGVVAGMFGLSQAEDTYQNAMSRADQLESEGKYDEAEAMRQSAEGIAPIATGAIEAVGEYFGSKYLGKLFGLDENAVVKKGAKNVVLDFLKTLGVETGTEIGQSAGESAVEKYTGIRPEADPLREALDVIGPTAFMTILTGGIAGGISGIRDNERNIKPTELLDGVNEEGDIIDLEDSIIDLNDRVGQEEDIIESGFPLVERDFPIETGPSINPAEVSAGAFEDQRIRNEQDIEDQRGKEERLRQSQAGGMALNQDLASQDPYYRLRQQIAGKDSRYIPDTAMDRLRKGLKGKAGRLISEKKLEKALEDNEFRDWAIRAENRTISDEEYANARKFIEREDEDKSFRDWQIKSQKSYATPGGIENAGSIRGDEGQVLSTEGGQLGGQTPQRQYVEGYQGPPIEELGGESGQNIQQPEVIERETSNERNELDRFSSIFPIDDTQALQSAPDNITRAIKDRGNLTSTLASIPEKQKISIRDLDNISGKIMSNMIALRSKNPEIFNSIIKSIPIDMMNNFIPSELSSDKFFHDDSMFGNDLAINLNPSIRSKKFGITFALLTGLKKLRASTRAKFSFVPDVAWTFDKNLLAKVTNEFHENSLKQLKPESQEEIQTSRGEGEQVTPEVESKTIVDHAGKEAATSPENDLPEPTQAQIEAGNYKKGHVKLHGLDISIKNPKGSIRKGVSKSGKQWETEMKHHYGYIRRTDGEDGDQIDVFIGPKPESEKIFVVDQVDPDTGNFDEFKVMMGFDNPLKARKGYFDNYDLGWKGLRNIRTFTLDDFKKWLKNPSQAETTQEKPEAKFMGYKDLTLSGKDQPVFEVTKGPSKGSTLTLKGLIENKIPVPKYPTREEAANKLELKPDELTDQEKIFVGKKKGEITNVEKTGPKAKIPEGKIIPPTQGPQVSLLPPAKGDTIDMFSGTKKPKPVTETPKSAPESTKGEPKASTPGNVRLDKGGVKPFFKSREITKGKDKGKIEVILTSGKKEKVRPEQIREYPSQKPKPKVPEPAEVTTEAVKPVKDQIKEDILADAKSHVERKESLQVIKDNVPADQIKDLDLKDTEWADKWQKATDDFLSKHSELDDNQKLEVVRSAFLGIDETGFESGGKLANDLHDNYLMPASVEYVKSKVKPSSEEVKGKEAINEQEITGQEDMSKAIDQFFGGKKKRSAQSIWDGIPPQTRRTVVSKINDILPLAKTRVSNTEWKDLTDKEKEYIEKEFGTWTETKRSAEEEKAVKGEEDKRFEDGIDRIGESDVQYAYVSTDQNDITFNKLEQKWPRPVSSVRTGMATTGYIKAAGNIVSGPKDVASLLASIRKSAQEKLYTVTVDKDGIILEIHQYTKGLKSSASTYLSEVAGRVLNVKDAYKSYMVHNHPSGDPKPSQEDGNLFEGFKNTLKSDDIESEMLVIGKDTYSIGKQGIEDNIPARLRKIKIPVKERRIIVNKKGLTPLYSSESAIRVLKNKYNNEDGVMFLDRKNYDIAFVPFIKGRSMKETTADLIRMGESSNASSIIINSNVDTQNRKDYIKHLSPSLLDLTIMDVIQNGESQADAGIVRLRRDNKLPESERFEELLSEKPIFLKSGDTSITAPKGKSILTAKGVQNIVNRVKAKFPNIGNVTILEKQSDIPSSIFDPTAKSNQGQKVFAYFDPETDTISIVAENMAGEGAVIDTLIHEGIGHRGVDSILSYDQRKELFDMVQNDYRESDIGKKIINNYNLNLENREDQRTFAREVIGHMAVNEPKASLLDRVITFIREALRKAGFKMRLKDAEIRNLLRRSAEFARKGGGVAYGDGVAFQVEAWHGGPHTFDKFSTEKIGTGEGAQAFGYGLYFTDLESIAKHYAETLSKKDNIRPSESIIKKYKNEWDSLINKLESSSQSERDSIQKSLDDLHSKMVQETIDTEDKSRNLYKVTLHKGKKPGEYTWIDWDKQPTKDIFDKIIKQAEKENISLNHREWKLMKDDMASGEIANDFPDGNLIYDLLQHQLGGKKEASLFLLRAGIDGIRYPAGSLSGGVSSNLKALKTEDSNGNVIWQVVNNKYDVVKKFEGNNAEQQAKDYVESKNPKNYVVFDESAVTIEERISFSKEKIETLDDLTKNPHGEFTKESKLAKRTEADSIEKKLTEDFGDLVEYKTKEGFMKDQAAKAEALLNSDYEKAKRIAMGEEQPSGDLRIASVYEAVKLRALNEGDTDLLYDLGTASQVPTRLSEYGQEIKSADSSIMEDPVKAMQDVEKIRKEKNKRQGKKVVSIEKVKKLQKQLDEAEEKLRKYEGKSNIKNVVKGIDKIIEKSPKRSLRRIDLNTIKDRIRNSVKTGREFSDISNYIQELAKYFISKGVTERKSLVKEVHNVIKEIMPDISVRETMDAISGYGKFKPLDKSEILVKLRDLKGQMQQVAKLEDMQAGQAPLKTGMERRTPTDEERRLIKQVEEMKKKLGIETVDSEKQLKSALDSVKTRLENQIKDLEYQIETRQKIVKEKTGIKYDAEANRLKQRRDDLRSKYNEIFGKPQISEEQRVKIAIAAVNKSIAEYTRRINENDLIPTQRKTPAQSEELTRLRKIRDSLKSKIKILRDLANPKKSAEEIALQRLKTRLRNEAQKLNNKLSNLDLGSVTRKETILDAEGRKLKAERDGIKDAYNAAVNAAGVVSKQEANRLIKLSQKMLKARQKMEAGGDRFKYGAAKVTFLRYIDHLKGTDRNIKTMLRDEWAEVKTTWKENKAQAFIKSTKDIISTISDLSISLMASLDNSFLGRQGLNTLLTHPSIWAPAAKKSFVDIYKTMISKHGGQMVRDAVMADAYSRPNFMNGDYETAKLIPKSEEQFPTSIPERIPGLGRAFKASENAFLNSGIRMRINTYDFLKNIAESQGVNTNSKEWIQETGKLINSITARGDLGKMGSGGPIRFILWAPKMLKGNLDVLTAHYAGAGLKTPFARQQAWKNLFKIVGSTALIAAIIDAIGKMFGHDDTIEWDPRSSDFMKAKVGNTRFDLTGGKASIVTLLARAATFKTKSTKTKKVTDLNSGKFGSKTLFDVMIDFMANKSAPVTKTAIDIARGRNFNYEKPTVGNISYNLAVPIGVQNFVESYQRENENIPTEEIVGNFLDMVGINTSTYDSDATMKRKYKELRQK